MVQLVVRVLDCAYGIQPQSPQAQTATHFMLWDILQVLAEYSTNFGFRGKSCLF